MKKIFKISGALFFAYVLFLVGEHVTLLYKGDTSFQAPYFHKMAQEEAPQQKPFVTLISYADGDPIFFKNQMGLAHSALNRGFDQFVLWRRAHLEETFCIENKEILAQKNGAGLWLWKPYIILKTLEQVPENSVVIYIDGSFVLKKNIDPLLEPLGGQDVLLLEHATPSKNFKETAIQAIPVEILKKFNFDKKETWDKNVVCTPLVIVRNTKRGRDFVAHWVALSKDREVMMRTIVEKKDQHPQFTGRYGPEQDTLFLAAQLYPNGVGYLNLDNLRGILTNVYRKSHTAWISCLAEAAGFHQISYFGYNSAWMVWLREKLSNLF